MRELILKDESYEVVGAAMEVYYQIGQGFTEPVYQEVLAIELARRGIPFEAQKKLNMTYKGQILDKEFSPILSVSIRSLLK